MDQTFRAIRVAKVPATAVLPLLIEIEPPETFAY